MKSSIHIATRSQSHAQWPLWAVSPGMAIFTNGINAKNKSISDWKSVRTVPFCALQAYIIAQSINILNLSSITASARSELVRSTIEFVQLRTKALTSFHLKRKRNENWNLVGKRIQSNTFEYLRKMLTYGRCCIHNIIMLPPTNLSAFYLSSGSVWVLVCVCC